MVLDQGEAAKLFAEVNAMSLLAELVPSEAGRCSPHLVGEAESLLRREVPCLLINNVGKGNGFVPSIELFKVKHSGVVLLPQRSTLNCRGVPQPSTFNPQLLRQQVLVANPGRVRECSASRLSRSAFYESTC
jgi:hypothetical protein